MVMTSPAGHSFWHTPVAYELATPVTYQLTPAQLTTLAGYNAVSTDAESVAVTYRADPAITLQERGVT